MEKLAEICVAIGCFAGAAGFVLIFMIAARGELQAFDLDPLRVQVVDTTR